MTTKIKEEEINYSNKCGEVFVTQTGIFSCFCIVCKQSFTEMENFTKHILHLHFELSSSNTEHKLYLEKNTDILVKLDIEENFSDPEEEQISSMSSDSRKSSLFHENIAPDPLNFDKIVKLENRENIFTSKTDEKLNTLDDFEISEFTKIKGNCKNYDSEDNSNCNEDDKFELPLFRCDVCNRSFKKKPALILHKKRHENVMPNCTHCGKYFRNKSSFNSHNQLLCGQRITQGHKLKSELPDIKCKYCEKIFKKTAFLKKHEELHEDSPFKCNYCSKKFMAKHLMEDHIRTHTGERPYKCEYCPVAFANQTNLRRHILIHIGERSFVCTIGCGKAFYTERERAGHERSHTGEKPFVCELCGRYFAFQHQMSLHKKRFHMDKKNWPHKCDQCDKAFIAPKHLREHIVVHTGEKPYACDQCPGRFSKASGLREHKKLHSGVKNHICTICNKAFAQTAGLYSHMKSHGVVKENSDTSPDSYDILNNG